MNIFVGCLLWDRINTPPMIAVKLHAKLGLLLYCFNAVGVHELRDKIIHAELFHLKKTLLPLSVSVSADFIRKQRRTGATAYRLKLIAVQRDSESSLGGEV